MPMLYFCIVIQEEDMGLSPQLITNTLHQRAVSDLQSLTQNNRAAIRLRAIVSAKEQGVNLVAKVFGVNSNTLRAWVKAYAQDGLAGLNYKPGRGRKSNLQEQHFQIIREWTETDSTITIAEIVNKLKRFHKVNSSKSAVHRVLHKLNLSYITPRPVHHKQDKSSHSEFKKKHQKQDREQSK